MANGLKSGKKDTGSVADLKGSGKVDRHEKTHNVEFAKGGDTKMFGEQSATDQKPSSGTAHTPGAAPGPTFAEGGKGKMFGFVPAKAAEAGKTSAY